jgi:hypothetical protein
VRSAQMAKFIKQRAAERKKWRKMFSGAQWPQAVADRIVKQQAELINHPLSRVTDALRGIPPAPPTIILDIDGTLVYHEGNQKKQVKGLPKLLKDVHKRLEEWDRRGCKIILLTGRRESTRAITMRQLEKLGIYYDHLIMGVGPGARYLVNDRKPNSTENTAVAINITRNEGLTNVRI